MSLLIAAVVWPPPADKEELGGMVDPPDTVENPHDDDEDRLPKEGLRDECRAGFSAIRGQKYCCHLHTALKRLEYWHPKVNCYIKNRAAKNK